MAKGRIKIIAYGLDRWEPNEVGEILENDFDKYHYKIKFRPYNRIPRIYYFFEDEVEVIDDETSS